MFFKGFFAVLLCLLGIAAYILSSEHQRPPPKIKANPTPSSDVQLPNKITRNYSEPANYPPHSFEAPKIKQNSGKRKIKQKESRNTHVETPLNPEQSPSSAPKTFPITNASSMEELKEQADSGHIDAKSKYGGRLQVQLVNESVGLNKDDKQKLAAWTRKLEEAERNLIEAAVAGHRMPAITLASLYTFDTPAQDLKQAVAWYYIDQKQGEQAYGSPNFIELDGSDGNKLFDEKTRLEGKMLADFYIEFYGIPR